MAFALSGSLITQTGTDTNLSGLTGVAGVTSFNVGIKTVYSINNLLLLINGTLTMDPRTEELWLGTATPRGSGNGNNGSYIRVAGTFNIGSDIQVNSVSAYPLLTAIISSTTIDASWEVFDTNENGVLVVTTGGTVNWYYGGIQSYTGIGCGTADNSASGTLRTYSTACFYRSLGTGGLSSQNPQVRIRSTQTNIDGLTTMGLHAITIIGNPTALKRVTPFHHGSGSFGCAFATSGSSPDATWLVVDRPQFGGGNRVDWSPWQGKWMRFTDAPNGSNFTMGSLSNAAAANYGVLESRHQFSLTVKNTAGAAITANAGWYIRDKNNGLRLAQNSLGNGKTNPDYVADRAYWATVNGSGVGTYTTDGGVLTHVAYRVFADAAAGDAGSQNKRDYRGEVNDNTDQFICRVNAYGYYSQELSVTLKNTTSVNTTLFTNTDIVANFATASAYTGITITDHGGSPVDWNGKSYGMTITGNLSTNPGLTAQMIHDYLQAVRCQVGTTIHGKPGGEWHDAVYKTGTNFATINGTYGGTRITKGVRVIDQSGNAFPGFVGMQADDGTIYVPPVAYTLTIAANVSLVDAEIRVYDVDNIPAGSYGTELAGVEASPSSTFGYVYTSVNNVVLIQILLQGYVEYTLSLTLPSNNSTITATLTPDSNT